ncbi:eCIS core domain-containing protein [Paenibacillus sp. FSL H8-0034]|uniref:eCIS core domain-containing protein n=1 Tax=Paenibacillus sp. FSL H8-0034 TaxID=2954671 RepID=UPI0030F9ADCA
MPTFMRKASRNSGRASALTQPQQQLEERRQPNSSMSHMHEPASPADVMQLQQTIGNKAVAQLMRSRAAIQRVVDPPEKESEKEKNGMPDQLKQGVESLSGMAMDDVKVHYNSSKPQELNALAYAQGADIHLGPGQEKHLPHEAWHVVQQKQGRVNPTMQAKSGVSINDDAALESEADRMGQQAIQMKTEGGVIQLQQTEIYVKNITGSYTDAGGVVQEFQYDGEEHVATTKSHPRGQVNYDTQVKKLLKKNNVVPKTITDAHITVSYESFGRKL